MKQGYSETHDSSGRTTLEVLDHKEPLLWLVVLVAAVNVVLLFTEREWNLAPFVFQTGIFGITLAAYLLTQKRMRVLINPVSSTLAVVTGASAKVLQVAEVERAQINSDSMGDGADGTEKHRVDLVLRSGKIVPLLAGYGAFDEEDCHRLVKRINGVLGQR